METLLMHWKGKPSKNHEKMFFQIANIFMSYSILPLAKIYDIRITILDFVVSAQSNDWKS